MSPVTTATTPGGTTPAQPANRGGRLPRSARREQLLAAALEVFVAQGYHNAAMDDIAERAGVSKPVLYQHFPGKLELYLALVDRQVEEIVSRVREAMGSTTDNKERVQNAMAAYFDYVDSEDEAFRLVFESDLRNDAAVRERVENSTQRCMEAVAETIAADTGATSAEAELLSIGLIGLGEITARSWLDSDRSVPKSEAVQLVASLAWRGISGFPMKTE